MYFYFIIRKIRKLKKIVTFIFSISLLIGCKNESKKENEPLTFQTKNLEQSFEGCNPEKGRCTAIELSFPIINAEKKIAQQINDSIALEIIKIVGSDAENRPKTLVSLMDEFISNYSDYREKFKDLDIPWEATVNAEVAASFPKLVSVRFESYVFTGGAHGYGSTTYLNFNPKTGEMYRHEDIFKPEFKGFIEKEFRRKEDIPAEANINSTGMFFENDEFQLPTNIGFEEDTVTLIYNPYEIAAYAAGQFSYTYSVNEIQEYLKIPLAAAKSNKD